MIDHPCSEHVAPTGLKGRGLSIFLDYTHAAPTELKTGMIWNRKFFRLDRINRGEKDVEYKSGQTERLPRHGLVPSFLFGDD